MHMLLVLFHHANKIYLRKRRKQVYEYNGKTMAAFCYHCRMLFIRHAKCS